ncbi:MAG: MFS transporter [bacterium]
MSNINSHPVPVEGLIGQIKSLPAKFWLINFLQMFEKMAYVVVLLQLPIYLAQKDVAGGMYLDQSAKGFIFFGWAIVQRLTPFFTGGFTDRIGYKKTLFISFIIIILSYLILGTVSEFWLFLFGIMLLGFGSGIFLPAVQALVTGTVDKQNESTGWGIYFMLLNLGVFIAPPISKTLKEISWHAVFYGSAVIFLLNFIFLSFIKIPEAKPEAYKKSSSIVLKEIFSDFFKPKVYVFILLMSCFVIIYMQFYETFPNFFIDWIDTSGFVAFFNLPTFMTTTNAFGVMYSYEWIRIIDSGLIIIAVVPVSWLMSKLFRINALMLGCFLATCGLLLCGASMSGWISIAGVLVYTLGELITNPKFTEQMNSLAPKNKKAQFMSYLNISFALGLGGGAILGGYIYQYFGEKANLALKYLQTHYHLTDGITLQNAMLKLQEVSGMNAKQATELLWNTYHPYQIWYPFLFFGVVAIVGLWWYGRKEKGEGKREN